VRKFGENPTLCRNCNAVFANKTVKPGRQRNDIYNPEQENEH
jgi:hypothetical protein